MNFNTVILFSDYKAEKGYCFVDDAKKEWVRISIERAKRLKKKPIKCAKCNYPAVWLDHHYPHYSDHNDCGRHTKP